MAIYNNYFGSGYNRQPNTQAGMAARQQARPQAPAQPMAARPPAAAPVPPATQIPVPPATQIPVPSPPAAEVPCPGVTPAPGQLPPAAYEPGPEEAPPIVRAAVQAGQTVIPPVPGAATPAAFEVLPPAEQVSVPPPPAAPRQAAPSPWAAANAGAMQGRAAPAPAAMTNAGAMQPAAAGPCPRPNAAVAPNQEAPTFAPVPVGVPADMVPYTLTSTYYLAGKLKEFCGRLVKIEFVLGTTGTLIDRIGILKDIGAAYVTLEHPLSETEITLCDMYSIKFVTIYLESGPVMIRGITA
jgi:hypothetical protein